MKFRSMLLSSTVMLLSFNLMGCASLVNGTSQKISLESWYEENEVEGAECLVKSKKGRQEVMTPAVVKIRRSSEDIRIECQKKDLPKGDAVAESSLSAWLLGNILFGGLIGLGIDALTSAGHTYPETITVEMGEKRILNGDKVYSVAQSEEIQVEVVEKK